MNLTWMRVSYLYAALVAVSIGYFLLRIPIQVTDSFVNILVLDRPFWTLMRETASEPGYVRPGLWAALKVVFDLSRGDYFHWFRWTQVLQVAATLFLFVRLLRPRSAAAVAVVPLAIGVLVGGHTFAWTVREAFPINTFLTIVVCCLAAANLALGALRRWHDVAAVAIAFVAAVTVETGLLAGGIVIVAYLLGARGVSRGAVIAITVLLVGYFVVRFTVLSAGLPAVTARDAGFGFTRRSGAELAALFGASRWPFYVYNVASSIGSVLFAEPRDGVFRATASVIRDRASTPLMIALVSSTLTTGLVVRFAWRRRGAWLARRFTHADRLVLLFVAVLAANAAISFPYTKDVIMSPAGVFFAAAVFVAALDLLESLPTLRRGRLAAATLFLALVSFGWGIRQVGLHVGLAQTSGAVREQWAYIDDWLARWGYDPVPPNVRRLRNQLQADAVIRHPAPMPIREHWTHWFEVD